MPFFVDPSWKKLLEHNHLLSFEQAWSCQAAWIETPNDDRGGWSGVSRILLTRHDGSEVGAFLKRQQNHTRRSWLHPVKGELTFAREFEIIRHLQKRGAATPQPVLFSERREHGRQQAVLMTEELAGYQSLEDLGEQVFALPPSSQRLLLRALATSVRRMHMAGIQHRSLYAKHLFIKPQDEAYQVALIDFEKSRRSFLPILRTYFDLVTLNYRTPRWSQRQRLYFFKQYYAVAKLKPWQKWLCRLIQQRSMQKRMQLKATK